MFGHVLVKMMISVVGWSLHGWELVYEEIDENQVNFGVKNTHTRKYVFFKLF